MDNNMIKELLLQAIEKNEVDKFLMGSGDYRIRVPHFTPVHIPTDWGQIIPNIYRVYKEVPVLNIKQLYEDTLLSMINEDNTSLYTVVNIVLDQLSREHSNKEAYKSPFLINKEKILPVLKKKLIEKQEDLKKDFSWTGAGESEGLWSEINRFNNILKNETGIGIL